MLGKFALIVFDVNGQKKVNDTYGHVHGDNLLKRACEKIGEQFKNSTIYRIGGDEFVATLTGEEYENREELLRRFDAACEKSVNEADVVIATGMAEYRPGIDNSFRAVFIRADNKMYERKDDLKKMTVRNA